MAIHDAVVAGLLYILMRQVVEQPSPTRPIEITMATPAGLELPPVAQPVVEPVAGPDPEPESEVVPKPPKEAPVVVHKPEPKPKPKPRPKPKPEKKAGRPGRDVKPVMESRPASPSKNNNMAPACTAPSTSIAATKPTVTAPSDLQAISHIQPTYPARVQALRIEGTVRVKFDVTPDGRTGNLQILSTQPANMFERKMENAIHRWRYE